MLTARWATLSMARPFVKTEQRIQNLAFLLIAPRLDALCPDQGQVAKRSLNDAAFVMNALGVKPKLMQKSLKLLPPTPPPAERVLTQPCCLSQANRLPFPS